MPLVMMELITYSTRKTLHDIISNIIIDSKLILNSIITKGIMHVPRTYLKLFVIDSCIRYMHEEFYEVLALCIFMCVYRVSCMWLISWSIEVCKTIILMVIGHLNKKKGVYGPAKI